LQKPRRDTLPNTRLDDGGRSEYLKNTKTCVAMVELHSALIVPNRPRVVNPKEFGKNREMKFLVEEPIL